MNKWNYREKELFPELKNVDYFESFVESKFSAKYTKYPAHLLVY